jgi:integrase
MSTRQKRKPKGEGSLFQLANGYWVFQIGHAGKRHTISLGTTNEREARREAIKAKQRLFGEIGRGEHDAPTDSTVTVNQLLELYIEYAKHNLRSADLIELVLHVNVRPVFGERKAASVTTADLEQYRRDRVAAGKSTATVNRELSYLRAAFKRGMKRTPPLVRTCPYFPIDKEQNVRTGFLELDGYRSVLDKLSPSLKPFFVLGYHLGCRKGELLSLEWDQVRLDDGIIELLKTKNGRDRNAPIYGDMRKWLAAQKALRDAQFPQCQSVFFWHESGRGVTAGRPIRSIKEGWHAGVKAAGHEGLLVHDLRRSAVRNMIQRAGVPESQAMLISGHETRSMLERYNIVSVKEVREVGAKMDAWMKSETRLPKAVAKLAVMPRGRQKKARRA